MSAPDQTFVIIFVDDAALLVEELTPGHIFWTAEVDLAEVAHQVTDQLNTHGRRQGGQYRVYRRDLYDMILARIE